MRLTNDRREIEHLGRHLRELSGRVVVVLGDGPELFGVVADRRVRELEEPAHALGCAFTLRTDDERELEIDLLDVQTVRRAA
ncbi:MAG: hypothetical protein K8H88_16180 [Sandaracinaceae bacterium]|nr:hypothetical protein [Sandaracinaceae bacterium]